MKKPVVDYRRFRFSKLNNPEFSHLKLLSAWIVYFLFYFLTEHLIPEESCALMHCALDDRIPFCEYFAVFYVFWYALVAGSLVYFGLYNVEAFRNLMKYIIVTQVVAMAVYIFFPNRQDLRPEVFPRDNFWTHVMAGLYAIDTSTNVCPSLHVAYSLGIASTFLKDSEVSAGWKTAIVITVVMICLSTAFVKQHSVLDILAGSLLGLLQSIWCMGTPSDEAQKGRWSRDPHYRTDGRQVLRT